VRGFAAKLRGFLRGQRDGDEFDAEARDHVQLLADRFVAQGMSREEAVLAAWRQFGNATLLHEDRRALQTLPAVEAWWHDVRYTATSAEAQRLASESECSRSDTLLLAMIHCMSTLR
jgi:hypothetical protein